MRKILWSEIALREQAMHTAWITKPDSGGWEQHTHDFHEVFWVDSGACMHVVSKHSAKLEAGTLVFIRPWDSHGFRPLPGAEPFTMVNIAFPSADWNALTTRYDLGEFWDEQAPNPPKFPATGSLANDLRRRFLQVLRIPRDTLHRDAFLLDLSTHLQTPVEYDRLDRVPAWLRKGLLEFARDPERLEDGPAVLADLCGCSPQHLCRVMRETLRQSPGNYIRQIRLRHAARLLETSGIAITEVALDSGFGNLSHFHRCFKTAYGQSPACYRRAHRRVIF